MLDDSNLEMELQKEKTPYRKINNSVVVKKRHYLDGLKKPMSLRELKKKLRNLNPLITFKCTGASLDGLYFPQTDVNPLTGVRETELVCMFSIAAKRLFTTIPHEEFYVTDIKMGDIFTPFRGWGAIVKQCIAQKMFTRFQAKSIFSGANLR